MDIIEASHYEGDVMFSKEIQRNRRGISVVGAARHRIICLGLALVTSVVSIYAFAQNTERRIAREIHIRRAVNFAIGSNGFKLADPRV